jgi:23S rRNA (pseudouridine1915-N3)-methyltransferase
MRIVLLTVGRPRDRELCVVHDRYAERISRFGVRYATEWVAETAAGGRFTEKHAREREGQQLLDKLGDTGRAIALDRQGTSLTSPQLAEKLERWATPLVTLVVGGPLGLAPSVTGRAETTWSLSPLTFPHELVRVLVAEQLYRALTLLRGHPYHK